MLTLPGFASNTIAQTYWNCSHCQSSNYRVPHRKYQVCVNCNVPDTVSDKHKQIAMALYLFGNIHSPQTNLLPKRIPFFIYPLDKPNVSVNINRDRSENIQLSFTIDLWNINKTEEYTQHVTKLGIEIVASSNGYGQGMRTIIDRTQIIGEFTLSWDVDDRCYGSFTMDIYAILEYSLGHNGGDIQRNDSPHTQITFNIPKFAFYHEQQFRDYILTQSQFEDIGKRQNQSQEQDDNDKYDQLRLIRLSYDSDDFQMVSNIFLSSSRRTKDDLDQLIIYKIMNRNREEAYNFKMKQILKLLDNDKSKLNEYPLYHGTDVDSIGSILHQGFLRQFVKKAVYGKGTYFARDASYSCSRTYAKPDMDGFQHVLLCNVICGEWTVGDGDMKIPPNKPNRHIPYETTVNDEVEPSVFVTYQDDQARPIYLVSFRKKNRLPTLF